MRVRVAAFAALLLLPALAGCTGDSGTPRLAFELSDEVYGYGDVVILLIRNEGDGTFRGTVSVAIENQTLDEVFAQEQDLRLAPTARAASIWNGSLPAGGRAGWGNYTLRATASSGYAGVFEGAFTVLAPATRHVKLEPVQENFTKGARVTLRVRNVGDLFINGTGTFTFTLQFADNQPQWEHVRVIETPRRAFAPGDAFTVEWDQRTTNGTMARAGTYRVDMLLHDEEKGDLPGSAWFRIVR